MDVLIHTIGFLFLFLNGILKDGKTSLMFTITSKGYFMFNNLVWKELFLTFANQSIYEEDESDVYPKICAGFVFDGVGR